jgi:hypothetical protein
MADIVIVSVRSPFECDQYQVFPRDESSNVEVSDLLYSLDIARAFGCDVFFDSEWGRLFIMIYRYDEPSTRFTSPSTCEYILDLMLNDIEGFKQLSEPTEPEHIDQIMEDFNISFYPQCA